MLNAQLRAIGNPNDKPLSAVVGHVQLKFFQAADGFVVGFTGQLANSESVSALTRSLWLVVLGLAVHALLDAFHGRVIDDAGVPAWWPSFCLTFDLAAALALAFVMVKARRPEGAAIPVPLNSGRGGRCGLDLGGSWPLN